MFRRHTVIATLAMAALMAPALAAGPTVGSKVTLHFPEGHPGIQQVNARVVKVDGEGFADLDFKGADGKLQHVYWMPSQDVHEAAAPDDPLKSLPYWTA
jgi:hypothetical protein